MWDILEVTHEVKESDGGILSSQAVEKENCEVLQPTPVDARNSQPVQASAADLVKDLVEEEVVVVQDNAGVIDAVVQDDAIVQSGVADSSVPGVNLVEGAGFGKDDQADWTPVKTRSKAQNRNGDLHVQVDVYASRNAGAIENSQFL
ncbi:hypothetical protein RIF29_14780 [Crotalaria pallida]|uniref:Uncharacterized protein n=1 Tax=Crotalaria pallida TaxID=3830 RepID=A0AAN9FHR0_CROPI